MDKSLFTSVKKKVNIFHNVILNILSNFIPHETLICDKKDPPWFNKKTKGIIQEKDNVFKIYCNNSSNIDLKNCLRNLQVHLNCSIECGKEKFYNKIANSLSTVALSVEAISKVIQNLDSNKAYGHDNISIPMRKICGDSVYKPLEIIFRQALLNGVFPSKLKKGNIVPVHKKVRTKISKIIVQFLSFQFVIKSLKD